MNNSKIWLVVSPNLGIPVFLGAVAVGSFAVHVSVLSNTTWVADFLSGQPLGAGAETAALEEQPTVLPAAAPGTYALDNGREILVVLPDGTIARAVLSPTDAAARRGTANPPPDAL